VIFGVGDLIDEATFLKVDFKKKEGFKLSVKRAAELGLYRQDYCGCEFSKRARDADN
jgi:predicted adenine nucleotide alpha hydrolase (AANH) superfamily ATPase